MKTGRDHGNRRCPTKGATLHAGPNCPGRARWDLAVSSCPFIKLSLDCQTVGEDGAVHPAQEFLDRESTDR